MSFDTDAKVRGCAAFVIMLRDTVGITADEIKRLLAPKMIDAYLAPPARQQQGDGNG